MFHEDILYISYSKCIKAKFWLVKCVAKDFIWTTLNVIFSTKKNLAPSESRFSNNCISARYCPNTPYINWKLICLAFRWCINLKKKNNVFLSGSLRYGTSTASKTLVWEKRFFFLFNWSLFIIMQWNCTSIGSCSTKKRTNGSAAHLRFLQKKRLRSAAYSTARNALLVPYLREPRLR